MNITFVTKKLEKQLNEKKSMVQSYGVINAKKLGILLQQFRAAPNLGIFAPPMSPPHRCHELKGNRKGQLSVDLADPYRLIFTPNHNPLPIRSEGGLEWGKVTNIEIVEIEDTHG